LDLVAVEFKGAGVHAAHPGQPQIQLLSMDDIFKVRLEDVVAEEQ